MFLKHTKWKWLPLLIFFLKMFCIKWCEANRQLWLQAPCCQTFLPDVTLAWGKQSWNACSGLRPSALYYQLHQINTHPDPSMNWCRTSFLAPFQTMTKYVHESMLSVIFSWWIPSANQGLIPAFGTHSCSSIESLRHQLWLRQSSRWYCELTLPTTPLAGTVLSLFMSLTSFGAALVSLVTSPSFSGTFRSLWHLGKNEASLPNFLQNLMLHYISQRLFGKKLYWSLEWMRSSHRWSSWLKIALSL